MSNSRRIREDLACGLALLTRLPTGWLRVNDTLWSLADSVWCWPLIGMLAGLTGALGFSALTAMHIPSLPAATCAVALQIGLTGGLHEDGLADTTDGLGGRDREHKLTIMRDSRIGSYGVLAIVLALMLRICALGSLTKIAALPLLVASGTSSRMILPLLPLLIPSARPDGLATHLSGLPRHNALRCLFVGLAILCIDLGPLKACETLCVALAVTGIVAWLAKRQIGGYTGDILGAAAVLTECATMILLSVRTVP